MANRKERPGTDARNGSERTQQLDADATRIWKKFLPALVLALAARLTLNKVTRAGNSVGPVEWTYQLFWLLLLCAEFYLLFVALRPRKLRVRKRSVHMGGGDQTM